MSTFKNIGLIMCGGSPKFPQLSLVSSEQGYQVKKVLRDERISEKIIKTNYPEAEIVTDKNSIIQDENISVVVLDAPVNSCSDLLAEILQSGKQVRVV